MLHSFKIAHAQMLFAIASIFFLGGGLMSAFFGCASDLAQQQWEGNVPACVPSSA
jgi:hypothetical protein